MTMKQNDAKENLFLPSLFLTNLDVMPYLIASDNNATAIVVTIFLEEIFNDIYD